MYSASASETVCDVVGWTAGGEHWFCGRPAVEVCVYNDASAGHCEEHRTAETDSEWARRMRRSEVNDRLARIFWTRQRRHQAGIARVLP